MLKVLVADDEPLARKNILLMLQGDADVAEVFEANDGEQALKLFQQHRPQLLFLDIEMPRLDGMAVAEQLGDQCAVIFATAYDQHAVKAFDCHAIDYLLKPFTRDRFDEAMQKAKERIREKAVYTLQSLQGSQGEQSAEPRFRRRLVIKDPGRIRLVEVSEINFISGAGNYAEIHLFDGKHLLHRETLSALEQQLNPDEFIRIHRSAIVRRASVTELRANDKGDYLVLLKSGEQLPMSRRNRAKLAELIG